MELSDREVKKPQLIVKGFNEKCKHIQYQIILAKMGTIRKIQLEMLEISNIVTEVKDVSEELIYRLNIAKERINENENSSVNITQIASQREKLVENKKTQQSICELWDNTK